MSEMEMQAGWVALRLLSLACKWLSAAVSSRASFSMSPGPWRPLCVS